VTAMDKAHALVIGIAAYQHVPPLPSTVTNDAHDVHSLLVDPRRAGYPAEQTHLLLDGEATRHNIVQALARLAERADPDSSVLVYLSSHGGRVESGPHAGEYILAVDTVPDTPATLAGTAISGAQLTEALAAIPARKVLVVFDCCHAGGIGQPKDASAPVVKQGLPESYYEALVAGRGRAILASSRSTEYSWVLPGAANSLFTAHLLAGLEGGVASEDGLIRVFDLFEYLQPKVTLDQAQQHPVFKAELEENFPVALYLGGQKGAVAKVDGGFRYDAYISYVDREPDATWVWDTLVPRLEEEGLRIAVSGDVGQPGVARVVNTERGIAQARRTVIVLSPAYLEDGMADFENVVAQTMGIQEGTYRLLPVRIADIADGRLPTRLAMLETLDLTHPRRAERNFRRLGEALSGPVPVRV
jgi:hypothetical protein